MNTQIVYFLLLPDILLLDLAGPADAFAFANRQQQALHFELRYISPNKEVRSSIGLVLTQLQELPQQLEENAIVVLPGMIGAQLDFGKAAVSKAVKWLRKTVTPNQRVACICSGALTAARAGLLQHRRATTHHSHCQDLRDIDASIQVEENRIFVEDGNISTSAGVTAGIDLAMHLISEMINPIAAMEVARAMVVYMRRSGNDTQLSPWLCHRNHLHPTVHKVQEAIIKNPAHDWDLDQLAEKACTSTRHLTRLFKEHAAISVQAYISSLRINLAQEFLSQTDWSIERVAEAAGFGSARQFRRVWQSTFHCAPSQHKLSH